MKSNREHDGKWNIICRAWFDSLCQKEPSLMAHRRLHRGIRRGIVAICLTIVLVLVGIIPEGEVPTVYAVSWPSTGRLTVYKYKKVESDSEINDHSGSWKDYCFVYYYNGDYYTPYTNVLSDDNWPVTKTSSLFTHFKSTYYSDFLSRNYIRHSVQSSRNPMLYSPHGNNVDHGVWIYTKYNNIGEKNASGWNGMEFTFPDEGNKIKPWNSTRAFFITSAGIEEFRMQYYYGLNDRSTAGLYFKGDDKKIEGINAGGGPTNFTIYAVQSNAYTCINRNYTIGTDQVYTADADLFLQEGVTLTVPEGAVLCVKKGKFFVNGEIKCFGTILVENGGIIEPFESTGSGSRIILEEGGAMIIRKGGKVFAGCPKEALGTPQGNGWLDMKAGSSIINYGILIAGQCNFSYGQATLENHKDGIMCLGYCLEDLWDEQDFLYFSQYSVSQMEDINRTRGYRECGAYSTGNCGVYLGKGANATILKNWDGSFLWVNKVSKDSKYGQSFTSYTYDADGKCTVGTYTP